MRSLPGLVLFRRLSSHFAPASNTHCRAALETTAATRERPPRVRLDKTHIEHNDSALTSTADMRAHMDFRRSGPQPDSCSAAKLFTDVREPVSYTHLRAH